ncbi:hypothetical protein DJ70_12850 [Halorubrum halodurans]|uniref:Uncharacterized protein n=1 Tax=Halorubrum halodurans TaxID=1383851 RepID=A0A256IFK0_9EURY|nr:hypothetical protein DJ70_12850 [Halorubrum halodurans]
MEAGEASKVVALLDAGVPLVESQKDLTPFQRMVLLKELERQEQASQSGQTQRPGQVNQLRQPRGGGGETVTYVNDGGS